VKSERVLLGEKKTQHGGEVCTIRKEKKEMLQWEEGDVFLSKKNEGVKLTCKESFCACKGNPENLL